MIARGKVRYINLKQRAMVEWVLRCSEQLHSCTKRTRPYYTWSHKAILQNTWQQIWVANEICFIPEQLSSSESTLWLGGLSTYCIISLLPVGNLYHVTCLISVRRPAAAEFGTDFPHEQRILGVSWGKTNYPWEFPLTLYCYDMFPLHGVLLSLFLGLSQTLAHSHPETENEIEVQRALQAAAYHVSLAF